MSLAILFGSGRAITEQPVRVRLVREQVSVAAPIQGGFDLLGHFAFRKPLTQDVPKGLKRQRTFGLAGEAAMNLLQNVNMREARVAEELFSNIDVGIGEYFARLCNLNIAPVRSREVQ